jgi:hypothetical protein
LPPLMPNVIGVSLSGQLLTRELKRHEKGRVSCTENTKEKDRDALRSENANYFEKKGFGRLM